MKKFILMVVCFVLLGGISFVFAQTNVSHESYMNHSGEMSNLSLPDSKWDIGLYNPNNLGNFYIQYGSGSGSFGSQTAWHWGVYPNGKVFSGDFNGDGKWDIGLYNPNNQGNFYIQYGDGLGNFGSQTAWHWGVYPNGKLFSGDFNGDGKWDIGLYNPNNQGNFYIQYGTGSGSFGSQTAWHWGVYPNGKLFSGDFNGDGKWDIGLYNPNNQGNFYIQYGTGSGSFGSQTAWHWGVYPNGKLFSGDFNGDGKWDIGLYNPNNQGNFYIQYGTGFGNFGSQTAWHWGIYPNAQLFTGDFGTVSSSPPATPTPTPNPLPGKQFLGNASSRLFIDQNGKRLNAQYCADNIIGQWVYIAVDRPGYSFPVIAVQANQRCVIAYDLASSVLPNNLYSVRAALNQSPNRSWPIPCYAQVNKYGLCDKISYQPPTSSGSFWLPYPGNVSHWLTRVDHDPSRPGTQNPAQDFATPLGSDNRVVASRAGRVILVKENSNRWGCSRIYSRDGNFIAIRHADNSVTYYVHLKYNGAIVNKNQIVKAGDLIGYTGLSGYMCGNDPRHIHFHQLVNNRRVETPFADYNNSYLTPGRSYISKNYGTGKSENVEAGFLINEINYPPAGDVHILVNETMTNEIQLDAYSYLYDVTEMKLSTTNSGISSALWQSYTNSIPWIGDTIFVQFKIPNGLVSEIYSDTVDSTAYFELDVNFSVENNEVCVGEELVLYNESIPYCPQCSWEWDFGDDYISNAMNPSDSLQQAWINEFPYEFESAYQQSGTYTITLSGASAANSDTYMQNITVIERPSAGFLIERIGNEVAVTANDLTASSWEWDFGDGTVKFGQTVSHTYQDFYSGVMQITLTTANSVGCTQEESQFVSFYVNFVPFITQ